MNGIQTQFGRFWMHDEIDAQSGLFPIGRCRKLLRSEAAEIMPGARGAGTHDDWWAWSENVGACSTPSVWLRWPALVVCEREN